MPHIVINTAKIYYEIHGDGEREPLVLIAGYGCDHTIWLPLLEKLSKHFKVLIFDNRGSGQTTDDDRNFTLFDLAEDCIKLMQSLNFNHSHVLGHSMGGDIAQLIAIHQGHFINKLGLLNCQSNMNAVSSKVLEGIVKLQRASVDLALIMDVFVPWGFSAEFLSDNEKVALQKKRMIEYPYRQTLRGNERQLAALQGFDSRDSLQKILQPTFILGCDKDLLVLPDEIEFLHQKIKNSQLKMLHGSHLQIFETPEPGIDIIIDFFKRSS